MQFLGRFSFVIQSALLLLFFLVGQSYAMLDFAKEVRDRYQSEQFVRDFPTMTLSQAGERFGGCSPTVKKSIVRMVAKKDRDNDNKIFSASFFMATTLPVDIQESFLKKEIFNGSDAGTKKFLKMPIGRAIEWHAWCQQTFGGRLIFLPVFNKKFEEKNLYTRPLDCHVNAGKGYGISLYNRGGYIVQNSGNKDWHIGFRGANGGLEKIYGERKGHDTSNAFDLSGDELGNFLADLSVDFFQLSKDDIMLLLNMKKFGFNYGNKENLQYLLTIDKKVPFLDVTPGKVSYSFLEHYTLMRMGGVIKSGIKTGMYYVFPCFAIPLGLIGLSRLIEANCCHKITIEDVIQSNSDKSAINALIELSGNSRLLPYRFELSDATGYGWSDNFKMNMPFLLLIPAITSLAMRDCPLDSVKDYLIAIALGTMPGGLLFVLSCLPIARDMAEFKALLGGAIALSLGLGITHEWRQKFFQKNGSEIESKKIAKLLELKNVVMC